MNIEKAIGLANLVYSGRRSAGTTEPLIFKTIRVAMTLPSLEEEVVAILRYVPDITSISRQELLMDYSKEVVDALEVLAQRNESVSEFAERIVGNDLAKRVEYAFLNDSINFYQQLEETKGYSWIALKIEEYTEMLQLLQEEDNELIGLLDNQVALFPSLYETEAQIKGFLNHYEMFLGVKLNERQESAIRTALAYKNTVILGGAGTGVTQTLHAIIRGQNMFMDDAKIRLFSGSHGRMRKYLADNLKIDVETLNVDKAIEADLIILHDLYDLSKDELIQFLKQTNLTSRIIFVFDPNKIVDEEVVSTLLSYLPSVRLESLKQGAPSSNESEQQVQTTEETHEEHQKESINESEHEVNVETLTLNELLKALVGKQLKYPTAEEIVQAIELYEEERELSLKEAQREAVSNMLKHPVLFLSGEAGSGLAETVKAIVECEKLLENISIHLISEDVTEPSYISKRVGIAPKLVSPDAFVDTENNMLIIENVEKLNVDDVEKLIELAHQIQKVLIVNKSQSPDLKFVLETGKYPAIVLQR